MIWVAVVGGIAVLGFVAVAVYAVMLRHKMDDVMAEVAVVRKRVEEIGVLIGQLDLPSRSLK
ncbi:hypothetical protein H5399_14685 [Tessaracoccus sp. MC1627]|uniref:hypothetical protein n=1 Tax=Tessaracoccus sp. MC1627 TaxID=2760312 RepID=UPI0016043B06|nr:hypothetical protein [Tessaracoccus sp. MC1627]MBB1513834.1 hypothetical protein [Tessaracoccus sp. MC1627]